MVAAQSIMWQLLILGLILAVGLLGSALSATRQTDLPEDEVKRSEELQQNGKKHARQHARPRRSFGIHAGVKAEEFVRALMEGRWQHVTTDRDFGRILETFQRAIETEAAGFLIGFALRGRPTRVVWADVEVIQGGILTTEELQPSVPAGTRALLTRLSGFAFVENPHAEASDLRPSRLADRPWFLTDYPGRVSWTKLREAAERPGSMDD